MEELTKKECRESKKKKCGMFQFRSRIFLRAERLFWESSSLLLSFVVLEGARPPPLPNVGTLRKHRRDKR